MKADLIIKGGTLFMKKGSVAENGYVAVKGNKIIKTGAGSCESLAGENTKIIDAGKGRFVMPGIHDNHIHLVLSGLCEKHLSLDGMDSQREALEAIENHAKTLGADEWVIGLGYNNHPWKDAKHPVKKALDEVTGGRPAFFIDSELHSAWVNGRALELAGITKDTPDPRYGIIERGENGEPSGYLHELALVMVGKIAFDFSEKARRELIDIYMKTAGGWGITSASDMTPYLGFDLSFPDTFFDMAEKGELTVRINSARNLYEDIEKYLEMKERYGRSETGMYSILYMKQFLDGVIGNYTAMMLDPYTTRPDFAGEGLFETDKLEKAVDAAHRNNVAVRLHACGDGAVRAGLDAYEKAIKKHGKSKMRHMIEHIEVIDPADIKRFRELDVIASVQPEHIISGMSGFEVNEYPAFLGAERERLTWAFKTLHEAGAVLAFGSDTPVVEGNPFMGMYVALTRLHPDKTPEGGWNPQEILPMDDILAAYTEGAAYAEGKENELGVLEEGKLADIIIVDRNLLAESAERVRDAKVLCTMVDGKIIFNKL